MDGGKCHNSTFFIQGAVTQRLTCRLTCQVTWILTCNLTWTVTWILREVVVESDMDYDVDIIYADVAVSKAVFALTLACQS